MKLQVQTSTHTSPFASGTHLLGDRDVGAALGGVVLGGGQVHDLALPLRVRVPDQLSDQKGELLFFSFIPKKEERVSSPNSFRHRP